MGIRSRLVDGTYLIKHTLHILFVHFSLQRYKNKSKMIYLTYIIFEISYIFNI
nr:MAG TPA: hypothetical protein [Caudoviricetes sp.]